MTKPSTAIIDRDLQAFIVEGIDDGDIEHISVEGDEVWMWTCDAGWLLLAHKSRMSDEALAVLEVQRARLNRAPE